MKSGPLKNLSLIAAVIVLLLIVTSPVTTIWLIKREASRIVADSLQGLATSSLATMHVSEGFLDTALAVHGGGTRGSELSAEIDESTRLVDVEYEAHRATLRTDSERRAFDHLVECKNDYRATRKAVVELLTAGRTAEATTLFEDECVLKFHAYAEALGSLIEHNARDARARGAEIVKLCYLLLVIQLLLLAFFFVYGFFVPLTALWERLTRRPVEFRS